MVGCWTCRARKKRCGQQAPTCNECDRLGLQCDGYGLRPVWADGGEREHSYKMRIKEGIKRRHRYRRTKSLPEPLHTITQASITQVDNIQMIDDFEDYFNTSFTFLKETPFLETSPIPSLLPVETLSASSVSQYSAIEEQITHNIQRVYPCDHDDDYRRMQTNDLHQTTDFGGQSLVAEEFQLLLYYLDTVFWMQNPHLDRTATTLDRSWVLVLFHSSHVFKEALLQTSRYLYTPREHDSGWNVNIDGSSAFKKILRQILDLVKELPFEKSTIALASAVTLLAATALTTFYGSLTRNHGCIRDSLLIGRIILGHIRTLNEASSVCVRASSGVSESKQMLASALQTSYAQLLWIDTQEAATASSSCILQLNPPVDGLCVESNVEEIFGCRSWILRAFRLVIELTEWKKTCLTNGQLSMLDLNQRSRSILEQINQYQMSMVSNMNCYTTTAVHDELWLSSQVSAISKARRRASSVSCEDDVDLITRIYVQAITTYLHVIVVGANSSLLEIQSAIATALELLEQLRCIDKVGCVLWPLMIFSFLSTQSQRERCRVILGKAMQRPKLQKAAADIHYMAQKLWRLADEKPKAVWNWEDIILKAYGYNYSDVEPSML